MDALTEKILTSVNNYPLFYLKKDIISVILTVISALLRPKMELHEFVYGSNLVWTTRILSKYLSVDHYKPKYTSA